MDADAYTCGTCRHGNLYEEGCDKCEAEYEAQQALARRRLTEADNFEINRRNKQMVDKRVGK